MTSQNPQINPIETGTQAPAFELPCVCVASDSKKLKLEDFRDKKNVILAFYPKDMTPGCTREMSDFSEQLEIFDHKDTIILGISADSIDDHQKFIDQYNLKLTLISDGQLEAITKYGVRKDGKPRAERVTFIIDKKGVIRLIQKGMPDYQALLYEIENLE